MSDEVNHPAHYNRGRIEVVDFAEDQGLDKDAYLFNALKYLCRAGYKDPSPEGNIKDLEKAEWYIKRRIAHLKHELAIRTTKHAARGV